MPASKGQITLAASGVISVGSLLAAGKVLVDFGSLRQQVTQHGSQVTALAGQVRTLETDLAGIKADVRWLRDVQMAKLEGTVP